MNKFNRPTLVISRCLGFAKCRYNGLVIENEFVNKLKDYVDVITPCPEVDIELGVPRDPIRLVKNDDGDVRLFQPATDKDFTERMEEYSEKFFRIFRNSRWFYT